MAHILVVDDEANIGRAMRWELKGHDLKVVSSSLDALLALNEERFDAVVCDWNLGHSETGEHVLKVAARVNAGAKRFIVSGVVPEPLAALLVAGVAHRYIAKPWRPTEMREAVKQELYG